MSKTVIVVNISGGLVQDVFCSDENAQVIVVDWDCAGCDPQEDSIVEVETGNGGSPLAYVTEFQPSPLADLKGTDVGRAVRAGSGPEVPTGSL